MGGAAAAPGLSGQRRSALPGGGFMLTRRVVVDQGARVALLMAEGIFRLDVRVSDDTVRPSLRVLGAWNVRVDEDGSAAGRPRLRFTIGAWSVTAIVAVRADAPEGRMEILGQAAVRPAGAEAV
jgi:hypothetical protein